MLKYNLSLAEENVFGWQRRTSLAGREESFWLAEKKVVFGWQWKNLLLASSLVGRGERLWLAEKNVFVWQRRKSLAGSGESFCCQRGTSLASREESI